MASSRINMEFEERRAHVLWAAHILSYLTNQRPLESMRQSLPGEEDDEIEPSELDADTEGTMILTESLSSIRCKFLDCVAQLLSPSKGWDYVVATAIREDISSTEILVARNDGFQKTPPTSATISIADFCSKLEDYVSAADQSDLHRTQISPLTEFEKIAIRYSGQRADHWIGRFSNILHSAPEPPDLDPRYWPGRHSAVQTWKRLTELMSPVKRHQRELIVQRAYDCVISTEVQSLVFAAYNHDIASKLWLYLRYLARPVTDCRLVKRIAARLAELRDIRIRIVPRMPKASILSKFHLDLAGAWNELNLQKSNASELAAIARFAQAFKRDCAKAYSYHAEIQLFQYLEGDTSTLTVPYFGCSKKSCLLCEEFLQALPDPVKIRGRHGICYPAWGVPTSAPNRAIEALRGLEMNLLSRIKDHIRGLLAGNRIRAPPNVAQSSIVTSFSNLTIQGLKDREQQLESLKQEEASRAEERRIIEGHAVSADKPLQDLEPEDSCVMCNKEPAMLCKRCRSCYYCSRECQRSDWPSHKLLCGEFLSQSPRPSSSHKRAILFPVERVKPKLIWVPCPLKYPSDDEDYDPRPYEAMNPHPYLGPDKPFVETMYIEHNPVRNRNLGCGMTYWAPRKEGYSVVLKIREAGLIDGSKVNESLLVCLGTNGRPAHPWSGPIIAARQTADERYEDITLADFRHVLDQFVSYGSTEVRESDTKQSTHSPAVVRGVKICCYGEIKLHGSDPFVLVDVPRAHPTRLTFREGDTSPISRLLGTPIRLWKFTDLERWLDPPGWNFTFTADSNQNAAFLMMGMDPKTDDWGWAPLYWNMELGNVLAVREDGKDLDREFFRTLCYFTKEKVQPMMEDSMGAGLISRTKQEVLDFITKENLEKCREEMLKDGNY
ncbi:hypothetical protein F5Y05DRAFT_299180 [Hypoxylon sp. FL0543]|nr:hypothetical protein F5Y05DRAFT_299180 [Hypoxylon sp. FL0543]